jgi:cell division septation protein DedD
MTSGAVSAAEEPRSSPVAQLIRALTRGGGHIVLRTTDQRTAASLLQLVTPCLGSHVCVSLSATHDDPRQIVSAIADRLRTSGSAPAASVSPHDLSAAIDTAQASGRTVLAVVEDAERATASQLERVRVTVECTPGALSVVRLVLIGSDRLEATLGQRSARGLSSRIVARIDVPGTGDSRTAPTAVAKRAQKLILYYTAPAVLTATIALVGLPAFVERQILPASESTQLALARVAGPPISRPADSPAPVSSALKVSNAAFSAPIELAAMPVAFGFSAEDGSLAIPSGRAAAKQTQPERTSPPTLAKARPTPEPAAAVAAAISVPTPSRVVLQVGSFRNKRNALSLRDRLAARFPDVYVSDAAVAGATYHRVRIGSFRDDAAAATAQTALRESGFHAIAVLAGRAETGPRPDAR